jgi:hypothetical protein
MELIARLKESLILAAEHLTGSVRRVFMARTVEALGAGGQRLAERELGWDRETVRKGESESRLGRESIDFRAFNGPKPKVVRHFPNLKQDLKDIIQPHLQTDPKFSSTRLYCRLNVAQITEALIETKGYRREQLPSREWLRKTIDAMGYGLRKVRKCKPLKKVPEADQIFETVSGNRSRGESISSMPHSTLPICRQLRNSSMHRLASVSSRASWHATGETSSLRN